MFADHRSLLLSIEHRRQETKAELKARKVRVAEVEVLLRAEAEKLEDSKSKSMLIHSPFRFSWYGS